MTTEQAFYLLKHFTVVDQITIGKLIDVGYSTSDINKPHINYLINWNDFFKLYLPPEHRIQTIHSIEERVRNPLICAHLT